MIAAAAIILCACAPFALARQAIPDAPPPPDPRWSRGSLENDVRYLVRTDSSQDGLIVLRLSVDAGSLSEDSDHPGAAYLTAMLLHTAAAEAPAGRAVISLGEDLPAGMLATVPHVGQDAVSFTVSLPIADEKAITLALRYLYAIASGVGLDDQSILRNRPIVRGQRAALIGRKDRLLAAVMPHIAPGTRVSSHPAIPTDAAVCNLENDSIRAFHARRYTPERLTIIVSGDAPAPSIVERIRREFVPLPRNPAALEPEVDQPFVFADSHLRAAVAADPEMPHAVAEIVVVHPPAGPIQSSASWRESLIDRLAATILRTRLLASVGQPGSAIRGGGVRIGPTPGDALVAVASVSGDPRDWRRLVAEVAAGASRARLTPPAPAELDEAQRQVLDSIIDGAAEAESRGPIGLVDAAWESTLTGNLLISPVAETALANRFLPTVQPEEVQAALASRFRMNEAAFILFMPDGAGTPPPIDVLAAALPSLLPDPIDRSLEHDVDQEAVDTDEPEPGRVESLTVAARSGVTTAQFANGVRFHHRRMTGTEPRITIALVLAAPDADPANPPPPMQATAALWSSPATRGLAQDQVARLRSQAKIDLRPQVGPVQARLEISCPAASAREAIRLLHLLLTEPRINATSFDSWKWSMTQRMHARSADPAAAAFEAVSRVSRAGAALDWSPSEADLNELTIETLQRWVEFLTRNGPVEAAIVGDIDRVDALDLAATFLASLPARPTPPSGEGLRLHPAFEDRTITTDGPSKEAFVLVAVRGSIEPGKSESLDLAARILTVRLDQRSSAIAANVKPIIVKHLVHGGAHEVPLLIAVGTASPALVAPLAERIEEAFASLATKGPTESELMKARAQAIEDFDRQAADSAWWARTLAQSSALGTSAQRVLDGRDRLVALTADDVRDTLAAHDPAVCCQSRRLRIFVTPAEAASP